MGRIYASARKVHVWLGPAADEDALAVDELFEPGGWDRSTQHILAERHCLAFSHNLTPSFLSLEHFVSRSWFTRRWVLQEVCLGREVFVHCGEREILWSSFKESVFILWIIYGEAEFNTVLYDRVASLRERVESIHLMEYFKSQGPGTTRLFSLEDSYDYLLDLLGYYDKTVCLDEHDRLYSLYGLVSAGKPYDEQQEGLAEHCSVDYSVHFSHAYTVFASGAVEAGLFQYMIVHTLLFGSLADQEEIWPSWVPSWNLTRKMRLGTESFSYLRPSRNLLGIRGDVSLWKESEEDIWDESSICVVYMHGMRALRLRGCIHRICHVQSGTVHSDATSYLEAFTRTQHAMSSLTIEWVVALAMTCVPWLLSRPPSDLRNFCDGKFVDEFVEGILFVLAQRFMGLRSDGASEEQPDDISEVHVDWPEFASEAKRILEGLESFCYEVGESFTFGIAFAQVKPGDFVFRMPGAVNGKHEETGEISPSAFGLIIRPYHSRSDAGPATFRLVGMCVDWYPDVEDPEFVEVVLV